jgi:GNAT superfamily N-acetyltransferase
MPDFGLLDNPMWHSLASEHAHVAMSAGRAKRYPAEVLPFAGIAEPTEPAEQNLRELTQPGDLVGLLGHFPGTSEIWAREREFDVRQYVWDGPAPEPDLEARPMRPEEMPAMLALTALVYPAFFRAKTAELGDYFGIWDGSVLCAMAGIRMAFPGFREVSAVCTHPDYRGKGLGARVTLRVVHHILEQGLQPFLHTEGDNVAAYRLYEKLGFKLHQTLPFAVFRRV